MASERLCAFVEKVYYTCCCCPSWGKPLHHTESTIAIVQNNNKSPSPSRQRRIIRGYGASNKSIGRTQVQKIQPDPDSYYSDEDFSSSSESEKSPIRTMTARSPVKAIHLSPIKAHNVPRHLTRSSEDLYGARQRSHSETNTTLVIPTLNLNQRKRSFEAFKLEDIGQIRPELYITEEKNAPERVRTGKKIEEILEEYYGTIWFAIRFDRNESKLYVHLSKVTDLPPRSQRTPTYDSFVSACLLPDEKHTFSSRVVKNNLNPQFEEVFTFSVDKSRGFENYTLRLAVFDADLPQKCNAIGNALVPLSSCVSPDEKPQDFKKRLSRRSQLFGETGRLLISLAYLPSLERLSVVIHRVQEIAIKGTSEEYFESYVKVRLICGTEKIKTERTPVIRGTFNPVFTESLSYVVPAIFIDRTTLVVQLMQKGHLRKDKVLGQLILGPYLLTDSKNLSHFGQMLSGREAAKRWHRLYL